MFRKIKPILILFIFVVYYLQDCSCEPDCGLKLNCCHSHQDQYRIVETEQLSCTYPYVDRANKKLPGYYMVDKCPVRFLCNFFELLFLNNKSVSGKEF